MENNTEGNRTWYVCGTYHTKGCHPARSSLCCEIEERNEWRERAEKAEAEIEHIKTLLKDPSAVHINTLRGTIAGLSWDGYEHILGPHPCRERAEKAEAEVERLKKELDAWDYGTHAKREQERAKKAEADVEFWKGKSYEAEEMEGKHEAEVDRLSKLTEDCLNVIRVYCPTYYQDAMERFKKTNK